MSYSPTLGRWVQQDPAGYVDGLNLYESAVSNPIGFLDPLGTAVRPWPFNGVVDNQSNLPVIIQNERGIFTLPPNTKTPRMGDDIDFIWCPTFRIWRKIGAAQATIKNCKDVLPDQPYWVSDFPLIVTIHPSADEDPVALPSPPPEKPRIYTPPPAKRTEPPRYRFITR